MNDLDTRSENRDSGPYNPYEEYLKQRIADAEHENEYNFKPRTLTEKVPVSVPSRLVTLSFWLSIMSLILVLLSNIYFGLAAAIIALAAAITSRFVGNEEHRFHPRALAALIISLIAIAIVAFLFIFILYIYPELLKDPSYQEMLRDITEQLQQQMPEYFPTEPAATPDEIL